MGCFNVAGTMSKLTIGHGDKVAFFLLANNGESYNSPSIDKPGSMIITNEGPCAILKPYCPPIFGEYDDYGSIENIKRNHTVDALEAHFGVSIDQIVDIVTERNDEFDCEFDEELAEERLRELKELSGMWEHEKVVLTMTDYYLRENTAYKKGYFDDLMMKKLKFEFAGTEENTDIKFGAQRYNRKWVKDNVTIYTDGRWIAKTAFVNGSAIELGHAYHPIQIENLIGTNECRYPESCIAHSLEKYYEDKKKYEKIWSDVTEEPTKENLRKLGRHSYEVFHQFPVCVENSEIGSIEELELLHHFTNAMHSTNTFYFPAMSGEQHGNPQMDKILNDVRENILFDQLNVEW